MDASLHQKELWAQRIGTTRNTAHVTHKSSAQQVTSDKRILTQPICFIKKKLHSPSAKIVLHFSLRWERRERKRALLLSFLQPIIYYYYYFSSSSFSFFPLHFFSSIPLSRPSLPDSSSSLSSLSGVEVKLHYEFPRFFSALFSRKQLTLAWIIHGGHLSTPKGSRSPYTSSSSSFAPDTHTHGHAYSRTHTRTRTHASASRSFHPFIFFPTFRPTTSLFSSLLFSSIYLFIKSVNWIKSNKPKDQSFALARYQSFILSFAELAESLGARKHCLRKKDNLTENIPKKREPDNPQ